MKVCVAVVIGLVACADDSDPRWQLAHDRIVAIRTTPAAIAPGHTAQIDGLIARVTAAPAVMAPAAVSVVETAPALAGAIRATASGWSITAPEDLTQLRGELGLADTDPVTVDVMMTFEVDGVELRGTKSIRLDGEHANPSLGAVTVDALPISDGLSVTRRDAHDLAIDEPPDIAVRWLTSCGSLNSDDDQHAAVWTVEDGDATSGRLAVVVRDDGYGVAWQLWSVATE